MALSKANRLESLYKHSKRPQSSLRGPGGTTERRTDQPTDQQTNKRVSKTCRMVSIHASPCQKKSHSHDMQNKAVRNFPKQVQVLPLPAGNLGRSHKSTPPLDRRFPDPVLSSFRRQTPQKKSCAYVPQSARPGATAILKDPSAKLFKLYLPACEFIRAVVRPKQSLQRLSDSAV